MIRDAPRLRRRWDRARRRPEAERRSAEAEVAAEIESSVAIAAGRAASRPTISYPPQLPVSAHRDEIAEMISAHQVVILAGETGSGKTTQLPKICLELGRGARGLIGHTQPRRIAARSVAERIAEETGSPIGSAVGYQMRFHDRVGEDTLVKVMTDGILLAEIAHDALLRRYDTIIIDEAHERSLNIDFLLGYLRRILPRRPDLKVIITSATIEPERFAAHFDQAPILEVSGRTYPVEIRYRPFGAGFDPPAGERDLMTAITDAVDELARLGPGDVLVFLSGEREIRDAADALAGHHPPGPGPVEVLPLFGRLSAADQHRVFAAHQGRRIVLATNIAETSLTVPGVRYVVDAGTARISRFSPRTKVQRLPIEPISQASAAQRSGRCGRLSDGVAIRLYSQEDHDSRPRYTDPEILRTNLAAVLLRMADLDLGEVTDFPFLDPPDDRHVASGLTLLRELGAIAPADPSRGRPTRRPARPTPSSRGADQLTPVGRQLARFPVDPRLGRMIVAAQAEGCLAEVLPIVAGLTVADPRERPEASRAQAEASHRRFADTDSDFLGWLRLWEYVNRQSRQLSGSAFRRMCRREYLHFLRIREWQDLHGQLRRTAADLGFRPNAAPADPAAVHRALLTGLLSHCGLWDRQTRQYAGVRNTRFVLSPGSVLAKRNPDWVMVAELVDTTRLWGHTAARIDPAWIERIGAHLLSHTYSEPRWDRKRAAVMATQRSTLWELPVVTDRSVTYSSIDPVVSRDLFIRHALVQMEWDAPHRFLRHNRRLLEQAAELEERRRRRDLLVDEETLIDFFDRRIPPEAVSGRHFDTWWKRQRQGDPHLLDWSMDLLLPDAEADSDTGPRTWSFGGADLPLNFRFEPGAVDDGVTIDVPLSMLPTLAPGDLDEALGEGAQRRRERVIALLRSLPKPIRRHLVPIPDTADRLLEVLPTDGPGGPSAAAVARAAADMTGLAIESSDFDTDRMPDHLLPRYRIVDEDGDEVAVGRDLTALRESLAQRWQDMADQIDPRWSRRPVTAWDFPDLPEAVRTRSAGAPITIHPGLVDEGREVMLQPHATAEARDADHDRGVARLLAISLPDPRTAVARALSTSEKLSLAASAYPEVPQLLGDVALAVCDGAVAEAAAQGGPITTAARFESVRQGLRAGYVDRCTDLAHLAARACERERQVRGMIDGMTNPRLAAAVADIDEQLSFLVGPGFVRRGGLRHLPEVPRYLHAIQRRIETMPGRLSRDAELMTQVRDLHSEWEEQRSRLPATARDAEDVVSIRWDLQELRVALFAQSLGTRGSVSVKRVRKRIEQLGRP